jgi:hypothetical protein
VPPVEPVTLHNVVSVNGSGTARTGQAVVRAGAVRSAVLAPPAGNPPAIGRSAPGDPTPQMPPAKAGGARSTR